MEKKISKVPHAKLRQAIAIPFTIAMAIPAVILDISLEIYQHIAFPALRIPIIKRGNYIRIDRHKLSYLTFWDKLACAYCGYANGVAAYAVKIAGDTEHYWCAIKHKSGGGFVDQPHQKDFIPYGDEKAYEEFLKEGKKDSVK